MNALTQPKSAPRPLRTSHRRKARTRRSRNKPMFMARATEAATVLGVNLVLIGACLSTLGNMLPHQLTQEAKLQEIKGEVSRTSNHIEQLKQAHQRSLIPEVSRRISEDQGHLIRTNKRNLVWLRPQKTEQ
ncbi:hypothetical protein [Acaryochloris sp. IP29b_bin.137]|uniref:slr1601 family putative cell division protein n=1 Tax=Acaryochloris sp. IP29b_bin.137 TaxID=2969217 RepID=UPI002639D6A6|nr:hypothetical protein [Acaryochloris sp. IP29b_bin.137]